MPAMSRAEAGATAAVLGRIDSGSRDDRGVATVWMAAAIATVLVLVGAVIWLGTAVIIRHRAEGAAELAALAAAGAAPDGEADACAKAGLVAERSGVTVRECRLDGWDALVRVEMDMPAPFGAASGRARAGPVVRSP